MQRGCRVRMTIGLQGPPVLTFIPRCFSNNCTPDGLCGLPPDIPRTYPWWAYLLISLGVLLGKVSFPDLYMLFIDTFALRYYSHTDRSVSNTPPYPKRRASQATTILERTGSDKKDAAFEYSLAETCTDCVPRALAPTSRCRRSVYCFTRAPNLSHRIPFPSSCARKGSALRYYGRDA